MKSFYFLEKKKKESINYLKASFLKIRNPKIYEIFDYAEFLKNNEQFQDSIKYYSEVIASINKKHTLYSKALDGRGVAYERTNQWEKAEMDLLNSLNLSPNDAYVINYLAYFTFNFCHRFLYEIKDFKVVISLGYTSSLSEQRS